MSRVKLQVHCTFVHYTMYKSPQMELCTYMYNTCIYMYVPLCEALIVLLVIHVLYLIMHSATEINVQCEVDKLYLFSDGVLAVIGLEPLVRLCVILAELLSHIWTDVAKLLLQ